MIIKATNGTPILVDAVDSDLAVINWNVRTGYARNGNRYKDKRLQFIHRVILGRVLGRKLSKAEHVDHVNGIPLDNRRKNLRVATRQQNCWNRRGFKGSSSKYVGVSYFPKTGRWIARIKVSGIQINIGYFITEAEAAWMRDQWALELHGEFARLNLRYLRRS